MIILPENALMIHQVRNSSDALKDSLLRVTDTDQAYALDYPDGEDFDMDLKM